MYVACSKRRHVSPHTSFQYSLVTKVKEDARISSHAQQYDCMRLGEVRCSKAGDVAWVILGYDITSFLFLFVNTIADSLESLRKTVNEDMLVLLVGTQVQLGREGAAGFRGGR